MDTEAPSTLPGLDPTGVPGLDYVLRGGLPRGHLYLLEGPAGAGKTTLALQFLLEGVRRGEKVIWCTLSETDAQLEANALSHGWDLHGVHIANLTRLETGSKLPDEQYSFFSPADIELDDVTRSILDLVERERPRRLVFDPFSDVRLLARDPLRYRRQVLRLREHFERIGTTVLLILEHELATPSSADPSAEGVVHGIIALYQNAPDYGRPRRRLRVRKLRGINYREGFHDMSLRTGGVAVYPRLVATDHAQPGETSIGPSGIDRLDMMLGGGLDRGASLLITGPAGTGKSTLCAHFAAAAARRGERSAVYLFDETLRSFDARDRGLGIGVRSGIGPDFIRVLQVDPADLSPGEFANDVREAVEEYGASMIVLDSLNGYLSAMPDERNLALHLHELLTYLSLRNVVTVMTLNLHGVAPGTSKSPVEISYLADSVLVLRYFEAEGEVRRAAAVVKRRCGQHEFTIREMDIRDGGVRFGDALTGYRGVLSGLPEVNGLQGSRAAAE